MWAEDDLGAGAPPCLESYIAPADNKVYIMYHGTSREAAETSKDLAFGSLLVACLDVASTSAEIYRRPPNTL